MPPNHEAPPQLEDALARIEQAKANYRSFANEMEKFFYEYIGGMLKGFEDEKNFVIQLRHPKESEVKGAPGVLVGQIV